MIHRKPVQLFDKNGKCLGSWKSVLAASMESGYSKTVIKNCASCTCREMCPNCSYFRKWKATWKYTV